MYLNTHGHLQFKVGIYRFLQYLMIWFLAFGLTISFFNATSLGLERVSSQSNNFFALLIQADTTPATISFPGRNFSSEGFRIPVMVTVSTVQSVPDTILLGVSNLDTGVDYVIGDMADRVNSTTWRHNWIEQSFAVGEYHFFVLIKNQNGTHSRHVSETFYVR